MRLLRTTTVLSLLLSLLLTLPSHAQYSGSTAPAGLIRKTADESITNDSTLDDDSVLFFTMSASTKYFVQGEIFFDTGATEDFKYNIRGPMSPTAARWRHFYIVPGTTDPVNGFSVTESTTSTPVTGSGTTGGYVRFSCVFQNVTAGTFAVRLAQNTSGGTATTVLAGSYIQFFIMQ